MSSITCRWVLLVVLVVCLAPVAGVRAQQPEAASAQPQLLLYHAPDAVNLDRILPALRSAAESRGLTWDVRSFASDEVFLELLRAEQARKVDRYADTALFAGDRYLAGYQAILDYLDELDRGAEAWRPAPAVAEEPEPEASVEPAAPETVQVSGASSGSYETASALVPRGGQAAGQPDAGLLGTLSPVQRFVLFFVAGLGAWLVISMVVSRLRSASRA